MQVATSASRRGIITLDRSTASTTRVSGHLQELDGAAKVQRQFLPEHTQGLRVGLRGGGACTAARVHVVDGVVGAGGWDLIVDDLVDGLAASCIRALPEHACCKYESKQQHDCVDGSICYVVNDCSW